MHGRHANSVAPMSGSLNAVTASLHGKFYPSKLTLWRTVQATIPRNGRDQLLFNPPGRELSLTLANVNFRLPVFAEAERC